MNKQTRIAISGATGFLGRELVRELKKEGFENLLLLVRDPEKARALGCETVQVELTNPRELAEALRGVEVVFHVAAVVSFSDKQAAQIIETNVNITSHIVNAAIESGVKRIVHTSSIAALGGMRQGKMYIDESSVLEDFANTSPYGKSKFLCENQINRANALGIETVVVNPGIILGEGDSITPRLKKGVPFYTLGVTGYVDVKDVARAEVKLMQCTKATGERFVLVAENLSYRDVFSMGAKKPWLHITPTLAGIIWRVEALMSKLFGHKPLLTASSARASQTRSYYNGEKIKKYIDFKYTPISKTIKRVLKP